MVLDYESIDICVVVSKMSADAEYQFHRCPFLLIPRKRLLIECFCRVIINLAVLVLGAS